MDILENVHEMDERLEVKKVGILISQSVSTRDCTEDNESKIQKLLLGTECKEYLQSHFFFLFFVFF